MKVAINNTKITAVEQTVFSSTSRRHEIVTGLEDFRKIILDTDFWNEQKPGLENNLVRNVFIDLQNHFFTSWRRFW